VFWELTEMNSSIDFLVARPPVGVRARNGKYSDENGLMAPANCQHQRPAHQRNRSASFSGSLDVVL